MYLLKIHRDSWVETESWSREAKCKEERGKVCVSLCSTYWSREAKTRGAETHTHVERETHIEQRERRMEQRETHTHRVERDTHTWSRERHTHIE